MSYAEIKQRSFQQCRGNRHRRRGHTAFSGAYPIIAVDVLDSKTKAALSFGATHTVNAKQPDAVEAVMKIATEIDNSAEIIWGATIDPELGNKIRVIVVLSDVHSPLTENDGLYYSKGDLESLLADLDSPFSVISARNHNSVEIEGSLPSASFSIDEEQLDNDFKPRRKKFLGLF